MRFPSKFIGLLVILLCSCRAAGPAGNFGQTLSQESLNSLLSPAQGQYYHFDRYVQRMLHVDAVAETLQVSDALGASFKESYWVPSETGAYAFLIEGRNVRIKNQIDEPARDVLRLGDDLVSYAVAPTDGVYAWIDTNLSIALLQLDDQGQTLGQWTGGPLLPSGQRFAAGEMLSGGRMLLSLDSHELILVDCLASIQAKAWVFSKLSFANQTVKWVGRISSQPDRVLLWTNTGYLLYDVKTQTTVATIALTESQVGLFSSKLGQPHLGFQDLSKGTLSLVYPEGDKLMTVSLPETLGEPVASFFNGTTLLVQTAQHKVLKIRVSDALVAATLSFKSEARLGLGEDKVVAVYDSPLGYITIQRFDSDEVTVLKGFNRPYVQRP